MKRVLLLLVMLAFALPAFADSIVNLDGAPSSYAVWFALSGSGPLNYIGGNGSLNSGGFEVVQGTGFLGTHGILSRWSGGTLFTSTGLNGNLTHVLFNSQTDMLTARYTGTDNGVQITNGFYVQKLNLSYAGGYGNAWKGTLGAGYVSSNNMTAPEPGTLGLLGIGLVFVSSLVRRKQKVG